MAVLLLTPCTSGPDSHERWLKSRDVGDDQMATATSEGCDLWDELARIDVADILARQHGVPFRMDCQAGGSVGLSRVSVPTSAELTRLRARVREVLSHLPAGTPGTCRWTTPVARCGSG